MRGDEFGAPKIDAPFQHPELESADEGDYDRCIKKPFGEPRQFSRVFDKLTFELRFFVEVELGLLAVGVWFCGFCRFDKQRAILG